MCTQHTHSICTYVEYTHKHKNRLRYEKQKPNNSLSILGTFKIQQSTETENTELTHKLLQVRNPQGLTEWPPQKPEDNGIVSVLDNRDFLKRRDKKSVPKGTLEE